METLKKLLKYSYDLQEKESERTAYWHLQNLRSKIKELSLEDESLKTLVDYCPFEKYAVFCIECDRKGIKPLKHDDYLKL
jgi:hypothetical protein